MTGLRAPFVANIGPELIRLKAEDPSTRTIRVVATARPLEPVLAA